MRAVKRIGNHWARAFARRMIGLDRDDYSLSRKFVRRITLGCYSWGLGSMLLKVYILFSANLVSLTCSSGWDKVVKIE